MKRFLLAAGLALGLPGVAAAQAADSVVVDSLPIVHYDITERHYFTQHDTTFVVDTVVSPPDTVIVTDTIVTPPDTVVVTDTVVVVDTVYVPADSTPEEPPAGPSARGCPTSGYTRLVNVSTASQLSSALNAVQPGDQIRLAAGTYAGTFDVSRSGTSAAPFTVCGLPGAEPVLTGLWTMRGDWSVWTGLKWQYAGSTVQNIIRLISAEHVKVIGNEITGAKGHAGISQTDGGDVEISYNYIHHNGVDNQHDHGIYWQRTANISGNVIRNNLIVHNAARGVSVHSNSDATAAKHVLVAHNTVAFNGSTGLLFNDGDNNIAVNNIFVFNGEARDQKQIRVLAGNNNQVRNNLTYSPISSLADIDNQTSSPMSGNVVAQPQFVDKAADDYHLDASSPAVGLGLPGYATDDYDGKARDASPDAGAFER